LRDLIGADGVVRYVQHIDAQGTNLYGL
jgi:hypothetical protein